jgi:ADP-ribose pyrophosphatase
LEPIIGGTENLYSGKILQLNSEKFRTGNGIEVQREIVHHPGAVCMLALSQHGTIFLVEQFRAPVKKILLELPAGTLEPGESPKTTAVRELQEEIGMKPHSITSLGGFYVAPGYCDEFVHLFLCTKLEPSVLAGDIDEEIKIVEMTLPAAVDAIKNATIIDAKTISGILIWATMQANK